jgi:hypothetical protein
VDNWSRRSQYQAETRVRKEAETRLSGLGTQARPMIRGRRVSVVGLGLADGRSDNSAIWLRCGRTCDGLDLELSVSQTGLKRTKHV